MSEISKNQIYDYICLNCALPFWELDFNLRNLQNHYREFLLGLSFFNIPQENLDLILKYKVKYILIDLENEEEFSFCKKAYEENKAYRSKNTFDESRRIYCDFTSVYEKLPLNQKCAFHYMMSGKTQKEFLYDFGFNSKGTASTYWQNTLCKFNVDSVIKLRNKFR
ncbi:hypothetical protein [Treponema sp. C6A8]|uniref:hypothetical protein n=1 Tax=Treponema sp. C6A8 TaxID=1410609 RepID=UPI0012DCE3E3|nr:hypothetical protein [Treponema sp. C6A8]